MSTAYEHLKQIYEQHNSLEHADDVLLYESAVNGANIGDAMKQNSDKRHALITNPRLAELFSTALAMMSDLSERDQRNLELMHHKWQRDNIIPAELAREKAALKAKGDKLFQAFKADKVPDALHEHYKDTFRIARDIAQVQQEAMGYETVYQAMLDGFSPGLKVSDIEREFAKLDAEVPQIIQASLDRQASLAPAMALRGDFTVENQMRLNEHMAKVIGFDTERGKIGLSKGSSSMGGLTPDAIFIKTRCVPGQPLSTLTSTIHEAGHGLYAQNLPNDMPFQPVALDMGMAVHESQSIFMQYQVGMSSEFIQYISKAAQERYGAGKSLEYTNLKKVMQKAEPSFIRIDADELTYPMHITLRFELEKAIIEGKLDVKDLRDAFNEGMHRRLGITPRNDAEGFVQDVHWAKILQGYFPAYAIGTVMAAQFKHAALKENPYASEALKMGDVAPYRNWLIDNVHAHGSRYTAEELMQKATGEKLNSDYYIEHLKQRYAIGEP